jgi:high affinity sulfate transporter 1
VWLPKYQKNWLRFDIIAGITVLALLIPEGMAYAELAGLPPETVFYGAPAALIAYAIFGSSRQLIIVVSSTIAVMTAAAVGPLAEAGSVEYITLAAALAVLAGAVSILAGLLKLGRVSQFFSESVLTGFVFGLAMVIAIKQVPKMFGFEAVDGNFFQRLWDIIISLPETHLLTLLVAVSSIVLMLVLERFVPKMPAALAALVYGIAVVSIFNMHDYGVHIMGEIPAGFAGPALPDISLGDIIALLPGALGIALVAFAEAIGPARQYASKYGYQINADQELIGIGASNAGAGIFQGFPVGTSLSKTAANDNAGGKTQMAGIICAVGTVIVAIFLTPLFHNLPEATLAAIVIVAVMGMMNVSEMKRLYRLNRVDFWLAVVALVAVLLFEVLFALLIAVIVSLLAVVVRASQPKLSILGREPGTLNFSDVRRHPQNVTVPGLLVVRADEGLYFANAASLREEIEGLVKSSDPPIKAVILDLEMSPELDVPSVDMLGELKEYLEGKDVAIMLARVHKPVEEILESSGVMDKIGTENKYRRGLDAMLDYIGEQEGFEDQQMWGIADSLRHVSDIIGTAVVKAQGEHKQELERIHGQLEVILKDFLEEKKQ